MTIHNRRELRTSAASILADTPNARRLVLIWSGAAALLSLLTGLLSYLLDVGIDGTGGLSGIGLRSTLTTAQEVLSTFTSVALPFWSLGYTHILLGMSRRQPVREDALLEGFRRFGPGLRLMLLQSLLYSGIFMFCMYLAILILGMTPMAEPAYAILEPMMNQLQADPGWEPDAATADALIAALLPMSICGVALAAAVLIPLSYRLRFAQLRIMDDPRCGARQAMGESIRATRKNCIALLKLDLGFWWFWLLQGLILAVTYGNSLLPMLGIALPVSPEIAFWGFNVAALVLQVAVCTAFHNRVHITYALAYDALMPKPENWQQAPRY